MTGLYTLYRKNNGFGFAWIDSDKPIMCPCINMLKIIIKTNSRKSWIINYFKQRSVVSIKKTIALKVTSDIIYVNLKKQRAQNRALGNTSFNSVPIR
jgi:hypothetical protein